jgi:taurine--2-oxoglutarate transaminase
MYLGRVVESAPTETLFARPQHPYTQALLDQVPRLHGGRQAFRPIQGEVASALSPPPGCHFHTRCPKAGPRCRREVPEPVTEGPHTVAAIALETVVGTNGILVPPQGYLAGVRALCDAYGIMLVCDEVMAGFGRCGEWFAFQKWGVRPDLVCFAKGVNSGYLPLGGVVIGQHIADTFRDRQFPGGLTYSGHPLACASAVASINIFREEGIVEHARMLGEDVIGPGLAQIMAKHPSVGDVRGLGVFWAIELVRNRETREPLVPYNAAGADAKPMADLAAACKAAGLWPFTHFNRLHVVPPCNTPVDEVRQGLAIIDEALSVADAYVTG